MVVTCFSESVFDKTSSCHASPQKREELPAYSVQHVFVIPLGNRLGSDVSVAKHSVSFASHKLSWHASRRKKNKKTTKNQNNNNKKTTKNQTNKPNKTSGRNRTLRCSEIVNGGIAV